MPPIAVGVAGIAQKLMPLQGIMSELDCSATARIVAASVLRKLVRPDPAEQIPLRLVAVTDL